MCTLVTLRGRYLRLARSLGGSGALLRGPERGAGTMPALFSSASSSSGSWGICIQDQGKSRRTLAPKPVQEAAAVMSAYSVLC